ncbi:MAG: ABC transporter ATP-binding protein [Deinococcales bacterium]
MSSLLELEGVESGYHKRLAVLKRVSLNVEPQQCVALLGSNGAGKSTLLKTVMGLLDDEPRKGSIRMETELLEGKSAERIARMGIAYVVEGRGMFPELNVLESLKLGAFHRQSAKEIEQDLAWIFELFPRLQERLKQSCGTMSGGEQQMLAIARALMSRPKLLMLDEPSLGLAPLLVEEIFSTIKRINAEGMGVLLVEQNAAQALKIADYGYVLEAGRIVLEGTASELRDNENVKELYLGIKAAQNDKRIFVKRKRRWN